MSEPKNISNIHGGMNVTDCYGNTTEWIYNYAREKLQKKSEMTWREWKESERVKWSKFMERNEK